MVEIIKKLKLIAPSELLEKLAQKAATNPTFRNKLIDFGARASVQGLAESFEEIFQDNIGDYTDALGETWTKEDGLEITKATTQYKDQFDIIKNLETGYRAGLVGAGSIGVGDSASKGWDKGKEIYRKFTAKDLLIGPNDELNEAPAQEKPKGNTFTMQQPPTAVPVVKDGAVGGTDPQMTATIEVEKKPAFTIVDGVPVYLNAQDAILLSEVIPNINNIGELGIAESDIAKEKIQAKIAEGVGSKVVMIDKEKIDQWANTEARKEAVKKLFLGDKGVYLDAQKVPLTWEEYAGLQSMGDVDFLTDETAITSDGATIGQLKEVLKSKPAKDTPQAKDIKASDEINTNGEVNLDPLMAEDNANAPNVDEAIKGYEDFGVVSKNIYDQMSDSDKAKLDEQVGQTKKEMKETFRDAVLDDYEQTVSITEREANEAIQDEVINGIIADENIVIVDTFLADITNRINPDSLTEDQRNKFEGDEALKFRKVFKKGGVDINEVAEGYGVTPEKLLKILSSVPTSEQAYKAKAKIEAARNRNEARKSTTLNEAAIENTLANKINLKKKLLSNMLQKSPTAALKLLYSVMKQGSKTNIDKVTINAQEIMDNTRISNVSPKSYLNTARRLENRADRALLGQQDMVKASQELEKSLVADELAKAAFKTKAKLDRILDKVIQLSRDKKLAEKLNSTGHLKAFEALTAMLGKRKLTAKDGKVLQDILIEFRDNGLLPDTNLDPSLLPIVADPYTIPDVKNMTLAQVETIMDYINRVIADSKNVIKARKEENKAFGGVVAQVVDSEMQANPKSESKKESYEPGGMKWVKQNLTSFLNVGRYLQNMNEMADHFKLPKDSILRKFIRQVQGTGEYDNGLGEKGRNDLTNKIKNFYNNEMGAATVKRLVSYAGQRVVIPEFKNAQGGLVDAFGSVKKTDLIGMLLIYGSQDGKNRLAKYGIDVDSMVKTIQLNLHPDDIKIIKAIYKAHDLLKPGIEYVEKTLKGASEVEFTKGDDFEWFGEKVEGGYIHFSYRSDNNQQAQATWDQQELEAALGRDIRANSNEAAASFTKEGFKKARAKNVEAFVDVDLNRMIDNSLGAIIANNTMLIPIYNVMKFVNDKKISKSIETVYGSTGLQIFKNDIMALGRNTNLSITKQFELMDTFMRGLQGIADNFMLSKIIGSISSVFNNTISLVNVGFANLNNPTLVMKTGQMWWKLVSNPKSIGTIQAALADSIPSIDTDTSSYIVKNVNTLKLFENSEKRFAFQRKIINGMDFVTDLWLAGAMGKFDSFNKSAYAMALIDTYLEGKLKNGPSLEKLNEMTEQEIKRDMAATVNEEIKRIFPDKSASSLSYLQRHPVGRLFTNFFNDARIALNYVVFNRVEDIWNGVVGFPKDAAKNGYGKAIAKSSRDIVLNALILQTQLALIDAMMRSFRGEDDDDEKKGSNKLFTTRLWNIFIENFMSPWTVPRATLEMIPGGSNISYFMQNERSTEGSVRVPIMAWADTSARVLKNAYNVGFDEDWTDPQKRDVINALSGAIPLPTSIINNYIFGESKAFKTGAKTLLIPVGLLGLLKARASDTNVTDQTPNSVEVNASEIEALYDTLLETPEGRSQLKAAITSGDLKKYQDEDLYDIIFTESNGETDARPPMNADGERASSALGLGQFLTGTWNEYAEKLDLDRAYAEGAVPEGEIDGRTDAQQSLKALDYFHNQIANRLIDSKIKPDTEKIYTGHHFGAGVAVSIYKADDDELLETVYKRAASDASWTATKRGNPWVNKRNMTVGDFKEGLKDLLDRGNTKRLQWEENNQTVYNPNAL